MQDQTSAVGPGGPTNGTAPKAGGSTPLSLINRRLPRGRKLPDYAVEYFNQLVAQYTTLPSTENTQNATAKCVAADLIGEQEEAKAEGEKRRLRWLWGREFRWPWEEDFRWPWEPKEHDLNWGDVSGMEMALLQLLPEAYLRRYAWNLRARYHEVAGGFWYDFYEKSAPPRGATPPKSWGTAFVSVTCIPLGASGCFLLTPTAPEHPAGGPASDSPAAVELRADLSILLSDLQRLRSTIMAREEKHSRISLIGVLLAAVSLTFALALCGGPGLYEGMAARHPVPAPPAIAVSSPRASVQPPPSPAASNNHQAMPGATAGPRPVSGPPPSAAASPATATTPLRILQVSALVILCGILGGLISMLRRLHAVPAGSTPLFDTIVLDAGQFGIGLAVIYGGIFAMVLYLIFLSGILDTVIADPAQGAVFPRFTDAAPTTTSDYGRLLLWAFIAGFAEQLVPDVLNRLTARNAAAPARPDSGVPSRPA